MMARLKKSNNIILERSHKKNALLELIRRHQTISRYDLANITRLSVSTVWSLVGELLSEGLVREIGMGESKGGRPPLLLEINPEAGFIIGIDFDGIRLRTVVVNFKMEIIYSSRHSLKEVRERNEVIKKLLSSIREALDRTSLSKEKIIGIGIAAPGLINVENGICRYYPNLPDWRNVPLKDLLEYELDIPVIVENNCRATALGEHIFGAGQKNYNLVCIMGRAGIGAGIILNGQLYHGMNFSAGELGHITIERNGPRCRCGKKGCLEAFVSTPAILQRTKDMMKQDPTSLLWIKCQQKEEFLTLEIIWEAAAKGDLLAREIVRETGEYLGEAVVNVVNLLNPEMIILAGDLLGGGSLLLETVKKTIKVLALDTSLEKIRIVYSQLTEDAGAMGAATVVLQKKFNSFLEPI